jgi:glycosyltransferase involved in cell wall biosynthesis
MSSAPAVSVVMGVYNGQRFLAEALESITGQTFADFEFIAVDDGSTDATPRILRDYAARDRRMRVIRIAHAGIVAAANAGLAVARAPLSARADADDVCMRERFARQVAYLADHPEVVALGSRLVLIEPYGSVLSQSHQPLDHDSIDVELLKGSGWAMPQPVVMMRKEAVDRVGGYREEYLWSEDLDLFLRLAEVGRLANLPDPLLKYRSHPGSTNYRMGHVQVELSRKCVAETYSRRGASPPPTRRSRCRTGSTGRSGRRSSRCGRGLRCAAGTSMRHADMRLARCGNGRFPRRRGAPPTAPCAAID